MWTNELLEVRKQFEVLGEEYRSAAVQGREERHLPLGLWEALAKHELFISSLPHHGNDGIDFAAAALEGLIAGLRDGGTAISLVSQLGMCAPTIYKYAQPEIKDHYLKQLSLGKVLPAFATTEPQGGSDPKSFTTEITATPSGYRLNGVKWSITNAPIAAMAIVLALETESRLPVSVLVDCSWPGVDQSQVLKPPGLRSSPTGKIIFKDVEVPRNHILGDLGTGYRIMNEALLRERLLFPFAHLGGMGTLLKETFSYSMNRIVFKKPIGEFQYIRKRVTDMQIGLETARCMAHQALTKFLSGKDASMESSIGKLYSANVAIEIVTNAIKIFGSQRFQEGDLDEVLMSCMASSLAGGTEEMHREVIFQNLYRGYRRGRD